MGQPQVGFFVSCIPPTVGLAAKEIGRGRGGKGSRLYDSDELKAAKKELLYLFKPFRPSTPLDGPLYLDLTFTWPWLMDHGPKIRAKPRVWRDTKPDIDNLTKLALDCLAALEFMVNDSRICRLAVAKYFGPEPGIAACLKEAIL